MRNYSRNQNPAVDYFYSAAKRRSLGALWPIFAPARIYGHQRAGLRLCPYSCLSMFEMNDWGIRFVR